MSVPATLPTPIEAGISRDFMLNTAPELAKDIVLQIGSARELAVGHYNLSDAQWEVLKGWPAFRELIARANEELAGAVGMSERIRRQARYALATGGIAQMAGVMHSPKATPQNIIKAGEVLSEIGGVNTKSSTPAGAVINSGGSLISISFSGGRPVQVGVNAPIEGEATRVESGERHGS